LQAPHASRHRGARTRKKLPTWARCAILGPTRPHHADSSFTSTDRAFPENQQ
jgi:hypothetical protein